MSFKMKYAITKKYLTKGTERRGGAKMPGVKFMVAHDTGNPGSTAQGNVGYYERSRNEMQASAHIFVDDVSIIECIPFLTGTPEKAWHVRYNVTKDNQIYNAESNDYAGGVELCWGGKINSVESYKRYIWVLAYACYKFKLDPSKAIVGHEILDPGRKIDPSNAMKYMGKTYTQLLRDVVNEYNDCISGASKVYEPEVDKSTANYTIQSGDTFWSIANKFGTNVVNLQTLNPNLDAYSLQIGQVIKVKESSKPNTNEQPQAQPKPVRPYPGRAVRYGSRGRDVEAIQRALGFKGNAIDGSFGPNTEKQVKAYQKRHGLVPDGMVGPKTWNVMF